MLAEVRAAAVPTQLALSIFSEFDFTGFDANDPTAAGVFSPGETILTTMLDEVVACRAPRTARCAWWLDALTIAPPAPAARKRRSAVAHPTTIGARFSVRRSSTSCTGAVSRAASRNSAALLTQPVSLPAACVRSAACSATASSATSAGHHVRLTPSVDINLSAASRGAGAAAPSPE